MMRPYLTSGAEKSEILNLLCDFETTFSKDDCDLGLTKLAEHVIDTGDAKPIKQHPRRVPMAYAGEYKKAVEKLLKQGSVRPSSSPWASPLLLITKRDGTVRPVIDYRAVNAISKQDAFPLPRM